MQVGRKIPYDNPDLVAGLSTVDILRISYVTVNLLVMGAYYYCTIKVSF